MARGPAYPFVNLATAVDILAKLYSYAKRGPAAVSAVAKDAWGWSPTSSTPSKALAALRYFGLIDEIAGDKKQIKVSDRGYRILVDSPESPERQQALRDAALSPAPYQWVHAKWGADVPIAARSILIFERGFVASTVEGFLRDYKATMQFAGLTTQDGDGEGGDAAGSVDDASSSPTADHLGSGKSQPNELPAPPASLQGAKRVQLGTPAVRQDVFSIEEGAVTIQWPAVLSAESLQDIEDWLEIVKRKISRSLRTDDGKAQEAN